jgi:hypothetical protein
LTAEQIAELGLAEGDYVDINHVSGEQGDLVTLRIKKVPPPKP